MSRHLKSHKHESKEKNEKSYMNLNKLLCENLKQMKMKQKKHTAENRT